MPRTSTTLCLAACAVLAATSCSTMKRAATSVSNGASSLGQSAASLSQSAVSSVSSGAAALSQSAVDLVKRDDAYRHNTARIVLDVDGTKRTIDIALLPDAAPNHVSNFKQLINDGFYDGLVIHRALPGFLVQTGDPRTAHESAKEIWGVGGPGYTLPAEINLKHERGSVAMARLGDKVNPLRASNGSQFYISLKNRTPSLDGRYTVFGKVVSGLDTIDHISRVPTDSNDVPLTPIKIVSTTLVAGNTTDSESVAAAASSPAPADNAAAASENQQASPTRQPLWKRTWNAIWPW
ncbi:peptidylprolyl isomerase [Sulfuriroseicoccus oceanibius]|uniref:Peptidyl-prolyl cis-trans isomerase n=1 Tax=Sulfuriroseicoccus oceanibius TaxID=2707525 RepID=A0A7T7EZG6_9BACT|nr:peptidylprolyl isomerase [Sulfuriroseicoccus oceanibius]QQL43938.1 peptidylprolyl isomerase [Sulfuriroseicoccus oceanibius]